jgi:hypothetical protein
MRLFASATIVAALIAGPSLPRDAHAGDADAASPVAFRAEAKVTLDASGHPVAIEPSEDLPTSIRDYIKGRVATWRFNPPEQDGVTGPAVTYLRLGACAVPESSGGYRLAVDFKGNGPRYAKGPIMLPPGYPKAALSRHIEAIAVVTYVVGTDGRTDLEGIDYEDDSDHRADGIDDVLREWVRDMRYDPEQLAGHPVRTRLRVPVVFQIKGRQFTRRAYRKELREDAVKSEECRIAAGSAPPEGLQPVVLNSPVRIAPAG